MSSCPELAFGNLIDFGMPTSTKQTLFAQQKKGNPGSVPTLAALQREVRSGSKTVIGNRFIARQLCATSRRFSYHAPKVGYTDEVDLRKCSRCRKPQMLFALAATGIRRCGLSCQ